MWPRDRRSVIALRRLAWVAAVAAVFVGLFGVGAERWRIAAAGAGLLVLAGALLGAAGLVRRTPERMYRSATVEAVSRRPYTGESGECTLRLEIWGRGIRPRAKITVKEADAPLAKWPRVGDRLPVLITKDGPDSSVRVLWSRTPSRPATIPALR